MPKTIVLLSLLMLLPSCQTLSLTPLTLTGHEPLVCSQWLVIPYHGKVDASDDIQRIQTNNAKRTAYCAVK